MRRSVIKAGVPFEEELVREVLADFRRDGFCVIGNVLDSEEVGALRKTTDYYMLNQETISSGYVQGDHTLRHANELDRVFLDLLTREPIYSLMLSLFGKHMQQCGMNVIRNGRGVARDHWPVDDGLFFPLPDNVPRHDSRIQIPVFWLTVQIAWSDIDKIEHGPTQYIPGSHYSGRKPPKNRTPDFEGAGPKSIFCKAGSIYLHDPQCWHRGAPNDSDRVRYLLQSQYGSRWGFGRYNAYIQHRMPPELLKGADQRLLGLIGPQRRHPEKRYTGEYYS